MPECILPGRSVVEIAGEDARHLLHNVLTCNVQTLEPGKARAAALLTPQGKVMFDFIVSTPEDARYVIDIDEVSIDDFIRRMTMYKLRAKAEISKQDESVVVVGWGDDSLGSETDSTRCVEDSRFKAIKVWRCYGASAQTPSTDDLNDWALLRIENGIAESGTDFMLGDAFAHDIGLDQTGGLDFRKGCYVGQEVVSRMQHRGTARRRVVIVECTEAASLPATGTALKADGKQAGTLGTVAGGKALAIARLDRLKEAMDAGDELTAGDRPVTVSLPPNVSYGWPQKSSDDNDG